MADKQGGAMPSGQGGLVRYYEADSGIELNPKIVIALSIGVGSLVIGMHAGIFF